MKKIGGGAFSCCISLGWFCGTASALAWNGLRSFSGPFDWCFSDLPSVLKMIEDNFNDFLNKNNLQVIDGNREFQDIKYGFYYPHDVKEDFEKEYCLIVEKYKRRIKKFQSAIKNVTCFFRIVRSEYEVRYIDENKDYIDKIIKQSNPQNEIIYLLYKGIVAPKNEICFSLNVDHALDTYEMLTMFSGARALLDYCAGHVDEQYKKANLQFFKNYMLTQRVKAALLIHDSNLKEHLKNIFRGKDIYVWGAGKYGVEIKNVLDEAGIKILGFLDISEKKRGSYINGIEVYNFENVKNVSTIFISITSLEISDEVSGQIRSRNPSIDIYTWSFLWDLFPINASSFPYNFWK